MPDDFNKNTSIEDEIEKSLQKMVEEETTVAKAYVGNADDYKAEQPSDINDGKTRVVPKITDEILKEQQVINKSSQPTQEELTDRDILLRAVACDKDTCKTPISEIMTTKPYSCDCNADITEAEKIMSEKQVRRIPVMENNKVIGMLTLGDLAANEAVDEDQLCDTIECICGTGKQNAE